MVVHVRLCDGPVHQYRFYGWDNYFSHVLERLDPPAARIRVVTACDAKRPGAVRDLVRKVGATVVRPRLRNGPRGGPSVAGDFLYLARATRLVVTESTYSWWAAFLGTATEIHAPGSARHPTTRQSGLEIRQNFAEMFRSTPAPRCAQRKCISTFGYRAVFDGAQVRGRSGD